MRNENHLTPSTYHLSRIQQFLPNGLEQGENSQIIILFESYNFLMILTQSGFELRCRTIANTNPDDLRGVAFDCASVAEIGIFRDNHEMIVAGITP